MNHPAIILLVDDMPENLVMLGTLCRQLGYNTLTAGNGQEAMELATREHPDLVLMDINMPVMDGLEATRRLRQSEGTAHIPVIMVTAANSREERIQGIASGANDFLTKPYDALELSLRIKNTLEMKKYQDLLRDSAILLEQQVTERTAELRAALSRLDGAYRLVKDSYLDTIQRLMMATEYKDIGTGNHIKRTSLYAGALAQTMGQDEDFVEAIYHAAAMHDIGKVGIPDAILSKPGPLAEDEWRVMRGHTTIGAEILKGSDSAMLRMAEEIALTHHERWDGSGYPDGRRGQGIPLPGRIVTLCDHYDALRSNRPYKKPMNHDQACRVLLEGDGTTQPEHFDPEVLAAYRQAHHRFEEIYMAHQDGPPESKDGNYHETQAYSAAA